MKLNCDMGESFGSWQMGNDEVVMPWIDMANIACGFHASDPDIMSETVKQAVGCGVTVGAHPGYNDKMGLVVDLFSTVLKVSHIWWLTRLVHWMLSVSSMAPV